jgi:hypothetical protein
MGSNFNLTREDLDRIDRKKRKLKVSISYKVDESLEIPDLENNFTPKEVKNSKAIKTEIIDLNKKKNKSNKLI